MRTRRTESGLVLGLLWVLIAGVAIVELSEASQEGVRSYSRAKFQMLEGRGVEVCEACFKAFETIAAGPEGLGLSGCERNYDLDMGLSAADWTELDPLEHLAILKKVMLFLMPLDPKAHIGHGRSSVYEGTIYETEETFRQKIETWLKYERLAISLAMIDIDNDGRAEPVFKYRHGADSACANPPNGADERVLVVLTPNKKSIDRTKTDLVMQHDGKRPGHPAGNIGGQIYDAFSMKGGTYFDRWGDLWENNLLKSDTIVIYRAEGNKVRRMCKFWYDRFFGFTPLEEKVGGQP
ncbi:MAG: hypothetical protein OEY86_20490 [Nitrospira sp.]|nr:hypothetical protein [Nitrospira sp.]